MKKKSVVKYIPLGGCGEIGKNMNLFEIDDEIVIVDCGLMFPDGYTPGVDYVIPDMDYVFEKKDNVKAIILTHGHEDHIGALSYLLKEVNVPIYGTKLTLCFVEARLREHGLLDKVSLNVITPRQNLSIGSFEFEFYRTTHSIADCLAILIKTPVGNIFHSGDFKIDTTPIDGEELDYYKIAEAGERGVLLMLSDSTNADREGFTPSERKLAQPIRNAIHSTRGTTIVATFASNIHRIQQVVDAAVEKDKLIAISGRSMEQNITIAIKLGYLNFPKDRLIKEEAINSFPAGKVIFLTTGSQGEPLSALSLLSQNRHKSYKIKEGDTVIISASAIPGNEKIISKTINRLSRLGAKIVHSQYDDIHVSGHGAKEELKIMLSMIKPKYFIPIHGEYRKQECHKNIALDKGIQVENVLIPDNGDVVEISEDRVSMINKVDVKNIYVDGESVGDIGKRIVKDRRFLSEHGIVVVILTLSDNGTADKVKCNVDILTRGFIYVQEEKELMRQSKEEIMKNVDEYKKVSEIKFSKLKTGVKKDLKKFFFEKTKRKPLILVRIIDIPTR